MLPGDTPAAPSEPSAPAEPGAPADEETASPENNRLGTFNVTKGGKAQIHKGEMILPPEVALVLRSLPGIKRSGPMIAAPRREPKFAGVK